MSDGTTKTDGSADAIAAFALALALMNQLIDQHVFTMEQAKHVFQRANGILTGLSMSPDLPEEEWMVLNQAIATLLDYSAELSAYPPASTDTSA